MGFRICPWTGTRYGNGQDKKSVWVWKSPLSSIGEGEVSPPLARLALSRCLNPWKCLGLTLGEALNPSLERHTTTLVPLPAPH